MWAVSSFCSVTFVPMGTTEASTSRVKTRCSELISMDYISAPTPTCLKRRENQSRLVIFRADGSGAPFERTSQGVPGEDCTFDARRIFVDSGEDRQFAHIAGHF